MNKKLFILNLEDNPLDAELNKETLAKEDIACELICVETRSAFLEALDQKKIDIILADLTLPTFDGYSALEIARKRCPNIPFIFVSGTLGEEVAIEALKKGATDYVLKDRLYRLGSAVLRAMKERDQRMERLQAQKALQESENTLKSIFRAAPTGIGVSVKRTITQANDRLLEMLGYSREEFIGQNIRLVYPDEDVSSNLGREMGKLIRSYGSGTIETLWKRKDGTIIDVLLSSTPINPADWALGFTFTALDITERKRMEEALRESEVRYRDFFTASRDCVFIISPDGRLIDFNDATLEMFGYDNREELSRVPIPSLYARTEDQTELQDRIVRDGYVKEMPVQMKRRDGRIIDSLITAVPLRNPDGTIKTFIGTIRDITERKLLEKDLEERTRTLEELYAIVTQQSEEIVGINRAIAGFTQTTTIEDTCALLTKTLREELLLSRVILGLKGKDDSFRLLWTEGLTSSIHEEEIRRCLECEPAISTVLKTGRRVMKKNFPETSSACCRLFGDCSFWPLRGKKGVLGVLIMDDPGPEKGDTLGTFLNQAGVFLENTMLYQDMTKMNEALQESETRWKFALEGSEEGVWDWNAQNNQVFFSNQWKTMLGYTEQEIVGTLDEWNRLIHPEDKAVVYADLERHLKGEIDIYQNEHRVLCKDGSYKWIQDRGKVMEWTEDGKPVRVVGTHSDITERKQAEEKIQTLLKEKELLLREVHHRIKNNMSTMISLLTLQSKTLDDQKAITALGDAKGRLQSMSVLYDKLYRTENLRQMSIKTYLPVLVDEVIGVFPKKVSVKIETQIDDFILDVRVLSPLGIIINELLTNIMKYAFIDREEGWIKVSAALQDRQATVVVEDNGIGLPESINLETSKGFGFQLVYGLTRQINGRIKVERGRGTRFVLEFEI